MDLGALRALRLQVQGLRTPTDASASEVVRRFVAVQAQEFLPSQWGLAMRVPVDRRPDAAAVAAAIDAGEILRTHVLRPTWHYVHPSDARWLLALSAERVHRQNALYYRRTGVEGEVAARGLDVVAESLSGAHRTRAELASALAAAGMPFTGLAFTYLLMLAELERVAISGAGVGKQRTYAAFDERVPPAPPRPRDEALAKLSARFIASRGPVTVRDFAAWSGFTLGDARRAFAAAADVAGVRLDTIDVDGVAHHVVAVADRPMADSTRPVVDLLQAYDEYIMGYAPPRRFLLPDRDAGIHADFPMHALMVDGVLAGRWAPAVQTRRATVRVAPWRAWSPAEERALAASVAQLERFLGVPVTVESATG